MLSLGYLLSMADESKHDRIEALYKYHEVMIKFAKKRLREANVPNYEYDAEDVVQSAYENMIMYIDSIDFNVSERQLKSYVYSVVVNQINLALKQDIHFESLDDYENCIRVEDVVVKIQNKDAYERLVKTIYGMEEKYGMALVYRYILGMSVKQIAAEWKVPEKTVYTRLRRAKDILFDILSDECEREYQEEKKRNRRF